MTVLCAHQLMVAGPSAVFDGKVVSLVRGADSPSSGSSLAGGTDRAGAVDLPNRVSKRVPRSPTAPSTGDVASRPVGFQPGRVLRLSRGFHLRYVRLGR